VRHGLNQRQLEERHVRLDVCFVVLVREGLHGCPHNRATVLHCWVHRLRLRWWWQNLIDVLHFERLIHPAIRCVQVVHLRIGLRQLQLLLSQGYALRHREDVRVADRDNVHTTVEILFLQLLAVTLKLVWVRSW